MAQFDKLDTLTIDFSKHNRNTHKVAGSVKKTVVNEATFIVYGASDVRVCAYGTDNTTTVGDKNRKHVSIDFGISLDDVEEFCNLLLAKRDKIRETQYKELYKKVTGVQL